MSVSDQLRTAIRLSGQTQMQIAEGAGCSQRAVSDYLRGAGVSSETMDAICDHLGLSLRVPKKLRSDQRE